MSTFSSVAVRARWLCLVLWDRRLPTRNAFPWTTSSSSLSSVDEVLCGSTGRGPSVEVPTEQLAASQGEDEV